MRGEGRTVFVHVEIVEWSSCCWLWCSVDECLLMVMALIRSIQLHFMCIQILKGFCYSMSWPIYWLSSVSKYLTNQQACWMNKSDSCARHECNDRESVRRACF